MIPENCSPHSNSASASMTAEGHRRKSMLFFHLIFLEPLPSLVILLTLIIDSAPAVRNLKNRYLCSKNRAFDKWHLKGLLYSEGVQPVTFLNTWLKYCGLSPNPNLSASSNTFTSSDYSYARIAASHPQLSLHNSRTSLQSLLRTASRNNRRSYIESHRPPSLATIPEFPMCSCIISIIRES